MKAFFLLYQLVNFHRLLNIFKLMLANKGCLPGDLISNIIVDNL